MNEDHVRWEDFRTGALRFNCSNIKLSKRTGDDVLYQGPGELWQDADRNIQFKCLSHDTTGSPVADMLERLAVPVGKLIPSDHYYTVTFVAANGNEWIAHHVSIVTNYSLATGLLVITGRVRSIRRVYLASPPADALHAISLRMLFTNQRDRDWVALTGDVIEVEEPSCQVKIVLERGSDALVHITSANQLPASFEVRVLEALRYVLARGLHPSVMEKDPGRGSVETTLFSHVTLSEGRLFPPLVARTSIEMGDLKRLFICYVTFVSSQRSGPLYHPCTSFLGMALEASANPAEAEVVGLCVAVEGIANLFAHELSEADKRDATAIQKTISRWLNKKAFGGDVKRRAIGLLSQLANVPVTKRLAPLIQGGALDKVCLDAWGRLRHRSVHPRKMSADEPDDHDFQETLDDIHRVYACMYQITFALVGYRGAYSDYTTERFPRRQYPLNIVD